MRQIAEQERDSEAVGDPESAMAYDPSIPLAHLKRAEYERDPHRAEFFWRFDLQHLLVKDPNLLRRAAEVSNSGTRPSPVPTSPSP